MSERPSVTAGTCQIRIKGGRLPDIGAIGQHLEARRIGASLRGLEAAVDGDLVEEKGALLLRIGGTGEVVELAPLVRKVEWDAKAKQAQAPTAEERGAFERLRAQAPGRGPVRWL